MPLLMMFERGTQGGGLLIELLHGNQRKRKKITNRFNK
jgi:hypothetical protein